MKRLIITEEDLTTTNSEINNTDIVFVPGFAKANTDIPEDFPEPLIPVLCRSVVEFERYFGTEPVVFASNQSYPTDFPEEAIYREEGADTTYWFNAGDPDPSYMYAKELLASGLPVLYTRVNGGKYIEGETEKEYEITVADMYKALEKSVFNVGAVSPNFLGAPEDYDVKYITSGGYPTLEFKLNSIAVSMLSIAETRGDAVALLDALDNPARSLTSSSSLFNRINDPSGGSAYLANNSRNTFGSVVFPWGIFNESTIYNNVHEVEGEPVITPVTYAYPGSFAYLKSLANSIKTNANFLPIAGVTRGLVSDLVSLHTNQILTNSIAESYQPDDDDSSKHVCINAITNIRPYGLCIWGNRTLQYQTKTSSKALRFTNFRNLISDVKKQARLAAQSLMFEQNTDVLWINFNSLMTPLLNRMVSGFGLKKFKIVKLSSDNDTKIKAKIIVWPIYSVESFDIGITITDDEVTVE